jgi:hypothetical protein
MEIKRINLTIKLFILFSIMNFNCIQKCNIEFQNVAFKFPLHLCNKIISDTTSQNSRTFRRILHIESANQVLSLSKELNYPDGVEINQNYLEYQLNYLKTINNEIEVKTREITTTNNIKMTTIFYVVNINDEAFGIYWISFVIDKFLFVIEVQMPFFQTMEEELNIIEKSIHRTQYLD